MNRPRRFPTAHVATLALLLLQTTHAQAVVKCMTGGKLVYQSTPCAIEARTDVVAATSIPAPAAAASASKKKSLADMLRERDGSGTAASEREPQGDGANLLRSRMGAL